METAHVLSAALEEAFRSKAGNALALRATFLFQLGTRIYDARRFNWPDPSRYQALSWRLVRCSVNEDRGVEAVCFCYEALARKDEA